MKFNSPLPQSLPKECAKAARIFQSFVDSRNQGLDGVIPRSVLENAKGFAIFSVVKAGFLFSARAGSGIVVAKLPDGTWSPPSAIGTAGMGFGGQAGAEITDFLVVLNSQAAVRSFMAAGSLTLGGNMSIALGPLGRNGEASSSINTDGNVAAMYSYSKTKGIFGGVSIEGSVIVERQDANALAYNSTVTAKMLLTGVVPPPCWANELVKTFESCTGLPGGHEWVQDAPIGGFKKKYAFDGISSHQTEREGGQSRRPKSLSGFPPPSWGRHKSTGSYFDTPEKETNVSESFRPPDIVVDDFKSATKDTFQFPVHFEPVREEFINGGCITRDWSTAGYSSFGDLTNISDQPNKTRRFEDSSPTRFMSSVSVSKDSIRAIAEYDFEAVEHGDLGFFKGEIITIIEKSDSTDDWWTGFIGSRQGIFPANFVKLL